MVRGGGLCTTAITIRLRTATGARASVRDPGAQRIRPAGVWWLVLVVV